MTAPLLGHTIEPVGDDFVRATFPNGTEVFYRDRDHSYWRECKPKRGGGLSGSGRLTGVSTLCAPMDFRPDSLMRWVERLTLEGVARGFNGKTVPTDPYMLRQMLDNQGLRWEQIREDAAERGTNVHQQVLHALASGKEVPDLSQLPAEQRGYGQAVLKWWVDRAPVPTHAEQMVFSDQHGFAGTLDLRCTINDPLRQGVGVVDAKTSSFISAKSLVQPAGYDIGVVDSGLGEKAEWLMILQLNEDGSYREVWSPATHEHFLNALAVYRNSGELNKAARAAA